eukprot:Unigene14177_Nuclearia_a/m.42785 Unigene14177_Nuclearia_a/g.42785  ORF Unigene14177_Nuclearia_a/g.42785 Unigene14177_Nuclearia_a/m.42785 type:complete len:167 (+) Unigene14177_Nuclearia_a:3-503(+)
MMEVHPAYAFVRDVCARHPATANEVFQVSLDLRYAKLWVDISAHELPGQDTVYLLARESEGRDIQAVVPVSMDSDVSVARLTALFEGIAAQHPEHARPFCVNLAVVATDSTVVYYRLFDVLVPPKEDKFGLAAVRAAAGGASAAAHPTTTTMPAVAAAAAAETSAR